MSVERITPDQVAQRVKEGWKYVDVRSVAEFDGGHPQGAYNVPFMHKGPNGFTANRDFLDVMSRHFARDEAIVVGCLSGGRSLRAARALQGAGFSRVVDMRGGFGGEPGPAGQIACEGWKALGLPVATQAEAGRAYAELSAAIEE